MDKYKKILIAGWVLVLLQFPLYNYFSVPDPIRILLTLGITGTIAIPLYLAHKDNKLDRNDLLINGAIIAFNLYQVFQMIFGNYQQGLVIWPDLRLKEVLQETALLTMPRIMI